ncbi:ankyrin repeat protein, putative [Bodo saltans]|uniref:Ankyrin repeat protein, putative n=1 Tax=Bodo saltans TaxID=75058 RepID=A0A0S4IR55_BODSA|nr:ankyrin repeat protein, putative [Bodo saltans]|eukprot:CUE76047.1 ankyrin repeat protein, putative [Bodo saltans]
MSVSSEPLVSLPLDRTLPHLSAIERLIQIIHCCLVAAAALKRSHAQQRYDQPRIRPVSIERVGDNVKFSEFDTPSMHDYGIYVAPETFAHQIVSKETDVYTLGGFMCKQITGEPPWGSKNVEAIQSAALEGQSVDVSQHRWPVWCAGLFQLVHQMLSYDPSKRTKINKVVRTLRYFFGTLKSLKSNTVQLFNTHSPYPPDWLRSIDICPTLSDALLRLVSIGVPSNRSDLGWFASNLSPQLLSDLQTEAHTIASEEAKVIALCADGSPLGCLLNAVLSQLACPDADLQRSGSVIKRFFLAVHQLGRVFKGSGFLVLDIDAEPLRMAYENYEIFFVAGSHVNLFHFPNFIVGECYEQLINPELSRIVFRCDNLVGYDIDKWCHPESPSDPSRVKKICILPPAYFTVKSTARVSGSVVVDLLFHNKESIDAAFLRRNAFCEFFLVDLDCERDDSNENGSTEQCVELLQNAVSRSDVIGPNVQPASIEGASEYFSAADSGNRDVLDELVKKARLDLLSGRQQQKQMSVRSGTQSGQTPLYTAACNGHNAMIVALLNLGAKVSASENGGWSPVHGAAHGGHHEALVSLIVRDIDDDALLKKIKIARFPLSCARKWLCFLHTIRDALANGHASVSTDEIKAFCKSITAAIDVGLTPLSVAITERHLGRDYQSQHAKKVSNN